MSRYTGYTKVWNCLDYAVCVLPVTRVDPVLDVKKPAHKFLSPDDQTVYELCMSLVYIILGTYIESH